MERKPEIPVKMSPEEVDKIRREAVEEGKQLGRQEMLDWLEDKYMKGDHRADRGSDEANAILSIARQAATHMRYQVERGKNMKEKKS